MRTENKQPTKTLIDKNGYYSEEYKVENIPTDWADNDILRFCGAIFGGVVYRYNDGTANARCYMD